MKPVRLRPIPNLMKHSSNALRDEVIDVLVDKIYTVVEVYQNLKNEMEIKTNETSRS